MRRQYLHLSAYPCDDCGGPVVSGWLAVRESDVSKETDIKPLGAVCLSCGHRQSKIAEPGVTRQFPPVEWESTSLLSGSHPETAVSEMLARST
jgi:hypothetical protein